MGIEHIKVLDSEKKDEGCYEEFGVSGYGVSFNLHRDEPISPHELAEMAAELMESITDECYNKGAKYIGHIKSYLQADSESVRADTVGKKHKANVISTITKPAKDISLVINSIVAGIKETEVKEATLKVTHEVVVKYGFHFEVEQEHLYFDEYDYLSEETPPGEAAAHSESNQTKQ